jgi:hypothetical protein
MENVEKRAAETILKKGVRVKLPAPFLLRMLFIRNINPVLRQPNMGTLLSFSTEALKSNMDVSKLKGGNILEALAMVHENAVPVSRMLAYLLLRSKWKIRLFTRPMANYLLWKLTPTRQAEIFLLAVAFGRVEDFTTTIRLIMAMKITTPKNLSPDEKGS